MTYSKKAEEIVRDSRTMWRDWKYKTPDEAYFDLIETALREVAAQTWEEAMELTMKSRTHIWYPDCGCGGCNLWSEMNRKAKEARGKK